MKKHLLFGAALAALGSFAAPAHAGDFDVTLEGFAAFADADADFINPPTDKADNAISGTLAGVRIGAEYAFGESTDGLFVGANYYTTVGDGISSEPERNGNYLIHHTVLDGFSGWEVNAGWDFGRIALGVGYGELTRDTTTYQSCPEDWNAVVAGFCRGGGVLPNNEGREGLRGGSPAEETTDSFRYFGRYDISERFAFTVSYQTADFDQSVAPLAVIDNAANNAAGNRIAHPDTSFAQDFRLFMIGAQVRF